MGKMDLKTEAICSKLMKIFPLPTGNPPPPPPKKERR